MRRPLAIAAAALLAVAIAAAVTAGLPGSARSAGGPYTVRAIFDDASYAATGENVKIAGADVGTITSLGVTASNQAAVTITIANSDFAPFYANAHCTIRPESLIGDEYVDCSPGTSSAPALTRIRRGPGAGDHYLPVTRTSSPIDFDIVQNISTEPVRESLAVILGELGTGLAARGSDLNAVIHRADPALGNTDRVLRILDSQSRTLARLASSSDAVLTPLARERQRIAGFVTSADTTAAATATRAADISRTFHEFPSFLRQLRPLMADLGTLSDQGTPVMTELGTSAGSLGSEFTQLSPFARSARTALVALGSAAQRSQGDLVASQPLAERLEALGRSARPSAAALEQLLDSLNATGGIESLMNLLYAGVGAANGVDADGHYVRAEPVTDPCSFYAVHAEPGCSANFTSGHGSSAAARRAAEARSTVVNRALESVGSPGTSASSTGGLLRYLLSTGGSR